MVCVLSINTNGVCAESQAVHGEIPDEVDTPHAFYHTDIEEARCRVDSLDVISDLTFHVVIPGSDLSDTAVDSLAFTDLHLVFLLVKVRWLVVSRYVYHHLGSGGFGCWESLVRSLDCQLKQKPYSNQINF